MQLYKSYVFKTKDPVIDRMRTMVADEGLKDAQVADLSGVSSTTLHNWFKGDTKRPQFCTIMAVSRAMGYDVEFVKHKNGHDTSAKSAISIRKQNFG